MALIRPARRIGALLLLAVVGAHGIAVNGRAGEVVGAQGRVGSLLLRAGAGELAAVPRGVAPGGLSPPGTPIIVATPASALDDVLAATPEDRRDDLVLLCNGDARDRAAAAVGAGAAERLTAGCLFFGVPRAGAAPTFGAEAPPTTLAGPHAAAVAALVESTGPRCAVVDDLDALEPVAHLKLLWSSALWLVCAARGCDVDVAHADHGDLLGALVAELAVECAPAVDLDGLRRYSASLPGVTPSRALAIDELDERNGWFLRRAASAGRAQPTHERLLGEAGVAPERVERAKTGATAAAGRTRWWRHDSGLAFATSDAPRPAAASAVVVGAGMVGSAVARELAKRGARVVVVDARDEPAGALPAGAVVCDDATSGTFAWLNAQGKPGAYGGLNRLGLAMWRRVAPYAEFATFGGSLVASDDDPAPAGGAYAVDADVSVERVAALEPGLEVDASRRFHFYPDEGKADPAEAAAAVRAEAAAAGATFRWGARVTGLLRDGGRATGVSVDGGEIRADAVVLAAGRGVGDAALGAAVPMKHSPGVLAHTRGAGDAARMRPLLVDAATGVHFLQRRSGGFVVGGNLRGYAVASAAPAGEDEAPSLEAGEDLARRAARWLPRVGDAGVAATTLARRVLPEDGLPAVGWSRRAGAYVCASHSAITLAPVLGALAAAELADGVDVDLLADWRPDRFDDDVVAS